MLQNRGEMTPREAAESSLPFKYAPQTPRERIEQDWEVRLPLAATATGYLSQLTGASAWDGFDRLGAVAVPTLVVHASWTGSSRRPTASGRPQRSPGRSWSSCPRPTTSS